MLEKKKYSSFLEAHFTLKSKAWSQCQRTGRINWRALLSLTGSCLVCWEEERKHTERKIRAGFQKSAVFFLWSSIRCILQWGYRKTQKGWVGAKSKRDKHISCIHLYLWEAVSLQGTAQQARWPKQFQNLPANIQVEKGHGTVVWRLFPSASWRRGRNPKSLYITSKDMGGSATEPPRWEGEGWFHPRIEIYSGGWRPEATCKQGDMEGPPYQNLGKSVLTGTTMWPWQESIYLLGLQHGNHSIIVITWSNLEHFKAFLSFGLLTFN